jgi:glutamine kinase
MKKSPTRLSKGRILIYLEDKLSIFKVPKTLVIKVKDWKKNKKKIQNDIQSFFLKKNYFQSLAIRSSASNEDSFQNSNAGVYDSFLNIKTTDTKEIEVCINKIVNSYKKKINVNKSEIIIQQMIKDTYLSGVIFTHNLNNGSPYYVINYDDVSGLTNTVTSGNTQYSNRSLYVFRDSFNEIKSPRFKKIIKSVKELEKIIGHEYLDIEFACDKNLNIYLLQVRPIVKPKKWNANERIFFLDTLKQIKLQLGKSFKKQNKLSGETTIFGQMADWNPAEMIGKTPRILSFSLYEKLITSHVWADARELMGYKKLKNKKLMMSFAGQPYIDVRQSLNSFLPKDLPKKISDKLINHWLEKLKNNPILHDKIEFELAITCFSFDMALKFKELIGSILTVKERKIYLNKIKKLTINCIDPESQISVKNTLKKIENLEKKQSTFKKKYKIENLNLLINDCKKLGILPFSILARHAFIATTLVNSFKNLNILNEKEAEEFFKSIKTITSEMIMDLNLTKKNKNNIINFKKKYGHLRPGTYDIMSQRYDEKNYFNFNKKIKTEITFSEFKFTNKQKSQIKKLIIKDNFKNITFDILIEYIKDAIAAREYSKFIFTKSISHILSTISNYSNKKNIHKKIIPNLPINFFLQKKILKKNIIKVSKNNEEFHKITKSLKLPQIIHNSTNPFIAPFQINIPNFITSKKIEGIKKIVTSNTINEILDNKIVLIEGADPGYDWIFTHKIKGLVTKFGGANSHMAIRSSEFEIPAAIGCGENIFNELCNHDYLMLNCEDKIIRPIKLS